MSSPMNRKLLVLALAAGLIVAPLRAQLFPAIPVVDYSAILQLVKQLEEAVAMHQLSIQQLAQLVETYQRITQQYQQMVFNAKTLGNLGAFRSNWSLWWLVNAANTYGYNAGWVNAANGLPGPGYGASILPLPVYNNALNGLAPSVLQRVQYQYSAAQLADSVAQNALNTTGGIRSTASGTEATLANLRDSTLDPSASEVQVLQKISAGAYIEARTQNDSNKLLAASAEAAALQAKLKRDEIQAAAANYQEQLLLAPQVTASTANAGQAIHSFRFQ